MTIYMKLMSQNLVNFKNDIKYVVVSVYYMEYCFKFEICYFVNLTEQVVRLMIKTYETDLSHNIKIVNYSITIVFLGVK
jgi:hypothetical protein